ncbi:hypothetical protein DdX_19642 [Ditylenchus destructor]|uniref:Uncharacterized protein n=1 Tax=Ditylenchus destructor TaxID=166010 RepID=A0AAD4MJC5_9BILA|nr:hypothetical protein DdX_19642 [Ditylenchus destructor]
MKISLEIHVIPICKMENRQPLDEEADTPLNTPQFIIEEPFPNIEGAVPDNEPVMGEEIDHPVQEQEGNATERLDPDAPVPYRIRRPHPVQIQVEAIPAVQVTQTQASDIQGTAAEVTSPERRGTPVQDDDNDAESPAPPPSP